MMVRPPVPLPTAFTQVRVDVLLVAWDVMTALSAVMAGDVSTLDRNRLEDYSWDRQAELLESVFQRVML